MIKMGRMERVRRGIKLPLTWAECLAVEEEIIRARYPRAGVSDTRVKRDLDCRLREMRMRYTPPPLPPPAPLPAPPIEERKQIEYYMSMYGGKEWEKQYEKYKAKEKENQPNHEGDW